MKSDGDWRALAQTLGSAALGVGLGLGVLILGFFISRATLGESTTASTSTSTSTPARSATATPRPSSAAPTVAPTPAPPTTPPAPTKDPSIVTGFRGEGHQLAAIAVPAGYTYVSPISGRVKIETYQYIDGAPRTGTAVASEPTFPYVYVTASDREIKLRPGALDRDVQLLVNNGDVVAAGAPLFKTLTTAPSSWATFYDAGVTAQIVASIVVSGTEVDPVPYFRK